MEVILRRKKPVQSRAKVTASAILEAAEMIIIKEGYEKATTNFIAERAGVSIGSLYQYFPNKESIISAVIESTVSKIAVGVRTIMRESIELPLHDISRLTLEYLLNEFREHQIVLYSLSKQTPELVKLTQSLSVEKFTHATNMALLEQHHHEIKVDNLEHALFVIEVAVLSNIRRYILENPTDMTDDEFIDSMVRLFTSYLTF